MMESQWRKDNLWCVTEPKIASISYTWTIKNFSLHKKSPGYIVESSEFYSPAVPKTKWSLLLYPAGSVGKYENKTSLFIRARSGTKTNASSATFSFSILNCNKDMAVVRNHSTPETIQKLASGLGWGEFMTTADLFDAAKGFISNDTLTILCEINVQTESFNTSGDNLPAKIPESRLGHDFRVLLESELLSDVVLVADGKKFNAHRAILSARSQVFAAMFTVDMKEKNEDVVELSDTDSDVLQSMLFFIYTAEAPEIISVQHAFDLLAAADKYDLESLKLPCENYICSNLTVENVSETLVWAELHNAGRIKTKASTFIQNHIAAVLETDGWASLFRKLPTELPPKEDEEK